MQGNAFANFTQADMNIESRAPVVSARADARREQILEAAEACFREFGFHNASISKICKRAAMSPGHVYHYFENKEAIIEGIVRRKADVILARVDSMRTAPDMLDATLGRAGESVAEKLEHDFASLDIEILAEACRSPGVARIVSAADGEVRRNFKHVVRSLRRDLGFDDSEAIIDAVADMVAALFDGMTVRGVRHPDLRRDEVFGVFVKVLRFLIVDVR